MEDFVEVYKNATSQLQKAVAQTPQRIKKLNELISKSDLEEQDLLHLAEFENFNASQGYDITKKIKAVRTKRRKYKDELEILSELKKVANNNSKLEGHVNTLSKSLKDKSDKLSNRKYQVKVRTDLYNRFARIEEAKLSAKGLR